ncbi:hypothetical protein Bca52824_053393 [Brassica carinata]|uniref:Dymeclin n=1 Tax=Brassica carinata TaxID=52824 RepID=A0A8X7R3S5_BRACI|nr:hypothetical protein Bca52824_053393 [Brassica carinata]
MVFSVRGTRTTRSNFIDVSSVFALFLIFTITDSDYALVDSARLKEEETWEARRRRRKTPAVVMMFSVADYLITTFVREKSFPLAFDFWNKLLELPSSSRWPSDQHLIENGKSDSFEELHLSLDESKPVPHGFELLNFMIVAMSIHLISGPSPGPRDANPFIDAAMSQEKSLVFLAVRRLLLNYIFRTPPNAKGYLYSDGDSPGILERVGSAAECSLHVLLILTNYHKPVMSDESLTDKSDDSATSESVSKEHGNTFSKALANARDVEYNNPNMPDS